MVKPLTIRDAYKAGHDHGWNLASWNVHEIKFGSNLCPSVDWVGIGTISTVEDWLEAFECIISAADDHPRQYSPFEFTAAGINERDSAYGEWESDNGWNAFERGMQKGAAAYRVKYRPIRELRKEQKEYERDA